MTIRLFVKNETDMGGSDFKELDSSTAAKPIKAYECSHGKDDGGGDDEAKIVFTDKCMVVKIDRISDSKRTIEDSNYPWRSLSSWKTKRDYLSGGDLIFEIRIVFRDEQIVLTCSEGEYAKAINDLILSLI